MGTRELLAAHEGRGRRFSADGIGSFALDEGDGEPVLCLHGVPASSWLYRRVVPALAARGLRGIAPDLPGLGLADRPEDADLSWRGLGRWTLAALDALGLEQVHLLVHDVGGPTGLELLAAAPERVTSLTVLNAPILVGSFTPPWVMRPFTVRGVGEAWLAGMVRPAFLALFRRQGLHRQDAVTDDEIAVHLELLKRDDGGRAFLRMMRSFTADQATEDRFRAALDAFTGPTAVVWGEHDPALTLDRHGAEARRAVDPDVWRTVPGRHFLQEDNADAIADVVVGLSRRA